MLSVVETNEVMGVLDEDGQPRGRGKEKSGRA